MTRLLQAWCPSCREWTVLDPGQTCAWCSTRLVRRRGGWKRPDLTGRISEPAARAIHLKYQQGISARTLGRELYRVLAYKNARTCEVAIGTAFRRYGLPVRDRIAATVLASTTSGLSPRDHRERRRRRKAAGLVGSGTRAMQSRQPLCAGVRQQHPRKGQPCARPAMFGSRFCQAHDPARRHEIEEHLRRVRTLIHRDSRAPKSPGSHRKETGPCLPPAA